MGATRVSVRVEEVHRVIDASSLGVADDQPMVERNEVAECTLACQRAIAFDLSTPSPATSRFVMVDAFEISGGGIVRESLPDRQDRFARRCCSENTSGSRASSRPSGAPSRFAQRPTLLIITGPKDGDRKRLAKRLESRLFHEGRIVYFLGIGNVLYGVDADIGRDRDDRREHIRRLAEVANLMLDAGMILIVSAQELTQEELDLIKTTVDPGRIETVWVGDPGAVDVSRDLVLFAHEGDDEAVERVWSMLRDKGVIFQPW